MPTSCQTFESQTAAIRYELGDGHEFEFVEGTTPAELAPGQSLSSLAVLFFLARSG